MHDDRDAAWIDFRRARARYEPLLTQLGRMTDAPRSDWRYTQMLWMGLKKKAAYLPG
jgi:hypothetical protein